MNYINVSGRNESDAIWLTSKRVYSIYSISKAKLYRLDKSKKIRSKSDKPYGAKKGSRLWNKESIDLYIQSLGDDQSDADPDYIYNPIEKSYYPTIVYERIQRFEVIHVPLN
jgi:hypothetical protein